MMGDRPHPVAVQLTTMKSFQTFVVPWDSPSPTTLVTMALVVLEPVSIITIAEPVIVKVRVKTAVALKG